jgi:tetratricopeptide (TPR) repeat protein
MQQAEALYKAENWPEAVKAFEAVTKSEPGNGTAWLRLGSALHSLGRYEEAIRASQRAVEILKGPVPMFNLARSYARIKEKEKAFDWLGKAIDAGFFTAARIREEEDLAELRADTRFQEALLVSDKKTRPCAQNPSYQQFDFWVGEWEVEHTQDGQRAGNSSIQRVAEGCIILENWSGVSGVTGKSINFFNKGKGKWQQTWMGSDSESLEYVGDYRDGAMRFEGSETTPEGKKNLLRLTFFNQGPDRVRQLSEVSADEGKTWASQYDLTYVRKK